MEKRVTFNERWLPYLLVGPQMVITLVFFFWPSGQAIYQSVLIEDAFGGNSKFVFLDNFINLFSDAGYYASRFLAALARPAHGASIAQYADAIDRLVWHTDAGSAV